MLRRTLLTAAILTGPLAAQTPAPSAPDQNRVPAFYPGQSGSSDDKGRIPVTQGAGAGVNIQSFPQQPPSTGIQSYTPPQPRLSPYLNLIRGGNGGLSAIDYYNSVRPGQQALGDYVGRPNGQPFLPNSRGTVGGIDPETGLQSFGRSAGTPSSFNNYGGYFNRLGTIGTFGQRPTGPAATPQRPGAGRR